MAASAARSSHAVPAIKAGRGDTHWEPATHDLTQDLPALLTRLAADGFAAVRVIYNPADWATAPRTITVGDRVVKLGAFHTQRRTMLTLINESGRTRVDVHDDTVPGAPRS